MRIQELELLDKEIAIHTRLEQIKTNASQHEGNDSLLPQQRQSFDQSPESVQFGFPTENSAYISTTSNLSKASDNNSDQTMTDFHQTIQPAKESNAPAIQRPVPKPRLSLLKKKFESTPAIDPMKVQ